jgi:DNA-binding MarR family transcriptional regulator
MRRRASTVTRWTVICTYANIGSVQSDGKNRATGARETVLAATRALVGIAARSLHDVGNEVSLAQYRVLVLLDGRGPLAMGELAVYLDVHPSTITRVCDVLVDKQLIGRRAAAGSRRGVHAELTARGQRLVDQVMDHRRQLIDDALAHLSVEQQRRLACSLTQFAEAASEVSRDAWRLGWHLDDEEGTVDTTA